MINDIQSGLMVLFEAVYRIFGIAAIIAGTFWGWSKYKFGKYDKILYDDKGKLNFVSRDDYEKDKKQCQKEYKETVKLVNEVTLLMKEHIAKGEKKHPEYIKGLQKLDMLDEIFTWMKSQSKTL